MSKLIKNEIEWATEGLKNATTVEEEMFFNGVLTILNMEETRDFSGLLICIKNREDENFKKGADYACKVLEEE